MAEATRIDPDKVASVEDRLYSVKEVAEIFEVSVWTVKDWIKRDKLYATKRGAAWQVSRESMVKYAIKRYM